MIFEQKWLSKISKIQCFFQRTQSKTKQKYEQQNDILKESQIQGNRSLLLYFNLTTAQVEGSIGSLSKVSHTFSVYKKLGIESCFIVLKRVS